MAESPWLPFQRVLLPTHVAPLLGVRETLAAVLLLGVLVGVLFGSSFQSAMMTDDPLCVATGRIANERGLGAANAVFSQQLLRPFPVLIYALNYRLYQLNLSGYRLSNALWHLANTLLVLIFAWRFTRSRPLALVAAALFAAHFAHWENAIWLAAVEDLYAGFFFLIALLAYDYFRERRDGRWYAVAIAASLGAFLSKEISVMLAPMLLAADLLAFQDTRPWRGRLLGALKRTWPFFALTLLYGAILVLSGRVGRLEESGQWAFFGRHVLRHPINYLGWMVWPYNTAGEVPGVWPHSSGPWFGLAFWMARLAMLAVVTSVLRWGSASQRLTTVWMLLAIAPYVYRTAMFSRYSYLATAMFTLLVAQLARDLLRRSPQRRAGFYAFCGCFTGINVLLHHLSPSVATYKSYSEAARPVISQVLAHRAEIRNAAAVWLVDPPAFAPRGPVATERMWNYISQLACDEIPETRCLTWSEWQTLAVRSPFPAGIRVYRWINGELQSLR